MRVVFASYSRPDNNSGIQIFNLANELSRLGVECLLCVPSSKEAARALGNAQFEIFEFAELHSSSLLNNTDVLHVWTPRELARRGAEELLRGHACPCVVHLEENEAEVTAARLGVSISILNRLPAIVLDRLIRPNMSHPRRSNSFLSQANGITIVIERLRELCPQGIPQHTLFPSYQEGLGWDRPPDIAFRRGLGLADHERVVAYTGNAHALNWRQVAELYKAVELLRSRGLPLRLVRTGTNHLRLRPRARWALRKPFAIELGPVPRTDLPRVLSIADVLVEPGRPSPFNDYRFPSKLPEFLASGKPVILPGTNIGAELENGEECLLLDNGDPHDIAQKMERLLSNEPLRNKIGSGGRLFAEKHLGSRHVARKLHSFYLSL